MRDLRLGRKPKDLDVVTDANLDEVSKVLSENGWTIDEACQKLPPERIRTEIEKFNPRSISS